jgi:hypothetical protein
MHTQKFTLTVIILSLLVNACNLNSPNNSVAIGPTSTPTDSNLPPQDTPTVEATQEASSNPSPNAGTEKFDVCGFFTAADAEPIVGTALITVHAGTDVDDATGGVLNYCNYIGDDVALVLSISETASSKDSTEWQDQLLNTANITDPNATSEPSTSTGERAYWVVNEDAAGWYVAKYPYVFALVVGGNIGYAEDYKEDILNLAQRVADALP